MTESLTHEGQSKNASPIAVFDLAGGKIAKATIYRESFADAIADIVPGHRTTRTAARFGRLVDSLARGGHQPLTVDRSSAAGSSRRSLAYATKIRHRPVGLR